MKQQRDRFGHRGHQVEERRQRTDPHGSQSEAQFLASWLRELMHDDRLAIAFAVADIGEGGLQILAIPHIDGGEMLVLKAVVPATVAAAQLLAAAKGRKP